MLVGVLLAACAGSEPADPDDTPPETSATSSWTAPTGTTPPAFDRATLELGLAEAIALVPRLVAEPVFDAYDEVMAFQSAQCPEAYGYATTYGQAEAWYSQCEASSGALYSGFASNYADVDYDPVTGRGYRGVYLEASVLTPDGAQFSGAGYWARGRYGDASTLDEYIDLDGTLVYDGPAAQGTWLEERLAPGTVSVHRFGPADLAWMATEITGAVAGLDDRTGVDTVEFIDVAIDGRDGCAEPTGQIALRTVAPDWFDLTFDGTDGAGACDGCAIARWRGLELGEVCGDFASWTGGAR